MPKFFFKKQHGSINNAYTIAQNASQQRTCDFQSVESSPLMQLLHRNYKTKILCLLLSSFYLPCLSQQWAVNFGLDNKFSYSFQKPWDNLPGFLNNYTGSFGFLTKTPIYSSSFKFNLGLVLKRRNCRFEAGIGRDRSMQGVYYYTTNQTQQNLGNVTQNIGGVGRSECNFEKLYINFERLIQVRVLDNGIKMQTFFASGIEIVSDLNPQKYYGFSSVGLSNSSMDTIVLRNGEVTNGRIGVRGMIGLTTVLFNRKERQLFRLRISFISNSSIPIVYQFMEYSLNKQLLLIQYKPVSLAGIYFTISKDLYLSKRQ